MYASPAYAWEQPPGPPMTMGPIIQPPYDSRYGESGRYAGSASYAATGGGYGSGGYGSGGYGLGSTSGYRANSSAGYGAVGYGGSVTQPAVPVLPYGYPVNTFTPPTVIAQPQVRPPSPVIVVDPSRSRRRSSRRHRSYRSRSPSPITRSRHDSSLGLTGLSYPTAPTPPPVIRAIPPTPTRQQAARPKPDPKPADGIQLLPLTSFNPLLAGDDHQQILVTVDLRISSVTFRPQRLIEPGTTLGRTLTKEELSQPATYPGVTEMTITCDEIPQPWKIELKSRSDPSPTLPEAEDSSRSQEVLPLTVQDVLFGIQRSMRTHISHEEWAELSAERQNDVADAYIRRSRAKAETKVFEESQGVRRVDYLLDKHYFKGLILPKGPDLFKNVKLLVGKKQ
ncbi:hypothetical protein NM688_g5366 [Phlebia brevispora]|uniref:Uncharacterized protein n=1 Tax=Phlebia brevispora TaxID=194682 RepID=A0ACC1SWQ3_9APHY|nr:hypothetical protein NM688_g5366 [Phlebia brevispora]